MTLVMDGVRRATLVTSPLVPAPRVTTVLRPVMPYRPAARMGLDGIRPSVPTPREVLANITAPAMDLGGEAADMTDAPAMIDGAGMAGATTIPSPTRALAGAGIAFGLVATALVGAGLVSTVGAAPIAKMVQGFVTSRQAATTASATAPTAQVPSAPVVSAPAVAPAPVSTGLQQLLNDFSAAHPGMFSLVVKDLKTGETATIDADRTMASASLYKLFVAAGVYHGMDVGEFSPGQAAGGGSGRNMVDCLRVMINVSDNTCGRALGSQIGWGKHNAELAAEGYTHTSLTGAVTQSSASDVARLFERLYAGTLNSPASNDAFMALLKDQRVNNRLPTGLPAGTVFAHKTGDLNGYVHDAGIVYGPKTDYLVVAMSGQWALPGNSPALFGELSRQLWQHTQQ